MNTIELNTEQKAAVTHAGGPLLIIAGAGTGKTTVVTERIRWLISEKNAKPSEILALTFTEKASREMEERVVVALPYGYSQLWISTFHSFGDRILRNEAIHIGLNPGYQLMTEAEANIFIRRHLFSFDLNYFRPLGNPIKFIGALLKHFSRLKDEDISPSEYLHWAQAQSAKRKVQSEGEIEKQKYFELAQAYQKYDELKAKEGVADFSDLISNVLTLFRSRPNILKQYQGQFKYILVDEFQDTNFAQYALVKLLAPEKNDPNLTIVADDNQSIYRFRGAAVSNILMFMEHYPRAQTITLIKNYRSTQEILDKSYQLIKNNDPDTLEAKLGISKRLLSTRPSSPVILTRQLAGKNPMSKTEAKGDPSGSALRMTSAIECIICDRVEDEAGEVAKRIKNLESRIKNKDGERKYHWNDFAILVRANNHADPFVRALSQAGIPYQFLGPGALFQQKEIKDLIAYLRFLANIEDSISFYRILAIEHFELSPRDLAAFTSFAKKFNLSLFDSAEIICAHSDSMIDREDKHNYSGNLPFISQQTKDKLCEIVKMIHRHLKLLPKETAGQILYYFLEDTGMLKKFANYKTVIEEKESLNIAKFFDKLKSYEADHTDASVPTMIDWLDMRMELGESPLAADMDWMDNDAVTILTAHSAKGLEFPVVFMVNLVEGRFPTRERREAIPIPDELIKEILPSGDYHLEEERRLFYVGMTRAKDHLYFTASYYYGEGKRERKVSPFIEEAIGEAALKRLRKSASWRKKDTHQLFLFDWKKQAEKEVVKTTKNIIAEIRRPITYLSHSQMETFRFCPLHYKARYILKIPTPTYAAQSFGQTIHLTLRRFYTGLLQEEKWGLDKLLELYREAWIPVGYASRDHMMAMQKEGEQQLTYFFETFHRNEPLPKVVEQPFVFPLTQGLKVGGVIDRVNHLSNGKIEIIDYKTAANIPSQKDVDNDKQLTIYALAATEMKDPPYVKNPDDVILSLYFLGGRQKITTTRTREQLDQAKKDIVDIAHQIEASDFACSGAEWCKTCEYKMLCSV